MTRLSPHVPIHPDETLHSWVARLAAVHTGLEPSRILDDLGLDRTRLNRGDEDALAILSDATGADREALRDAAIAVRLRNVVFRGEDFAMASLSPRVERACPACLAEDGGRQDLRHRLTWCFQAVRWCLRHGTPLHATTGGPSHDLRSVDVGDPLDIAATRSAAPAHATWTCERVGGACDPNAWLAGHTVDQVLKASEMLGIVTMFGHGARSRSLDEASRDEATEHGFLLYRDDPAAITVALDDIRAASTATAVQAGPLAMYGGLYEWLDRRANHLDPGPIRDLLRDHIVEHSAIAPGETVLGRVVERRMSHTIVSLSEATGVERRRLGRLLVRLGHVPPGASDADTGRLVFPAERFERFCADLGDAVPLHDVPEYVSATRHQVEGLYAARILEPLVPPIGPGDVRYVVFARRHLDAVLDRIAGLPVMEDVNPDEWGSVPEACRRGAGPMTPLFGRVLCGEIPAARLAGRPGFSRVVVAFADVIEGRARVA